MRVVEFKGREFVVLEDEKDFDEMEEVLEEEMRKQGRD